MAQVLQLRRGTTAQNNTFTGAAGEVTVDTDRESLRIHDGSTMGGKEIADLATAIPLLADATTVNASDELIIHQGGVTKRATASELTKSVNTANGIINVKDFGAAGDGVADDTAAIQAAIDYWAPFQAFVSDGGYVYLPAGRYKTTSAINLTGKHGIYIEGGGVHATEVFATGNYPVFESINTASEPWIDGHIKNMTIRGGGNSNANAHGIYTVFTNGCTLENIALFSCKYGLNINHAWQYHIENVDAHGGGTDRSDVGVYMGPTTLINIDNAITANNITVKDCITTGFRIVNGQGSKFVNCEAGAVPIGWHIGAPASGTVKCQWIHFTNCLADTTTDAGWKLVKGAASEFGQMQFANCWSGNNTDASAVGLVYIEGGEDITFVGTQLQSCTNNGINLNTCNRIVFADYVLNGFNGSNSAKTGVLLHNTTRCVFTGHHTPLNVFSNSDVLETGTSNVNVLTIDNSNGAQLVGVDSRHIANASITTSGAAVSHTFAATNGSSTLSLKNSTPKTFSVACRSDDYFAIADGATSRLLIHPTAGHVIPGSNNLQQLGAASNRWSEVFAGSGTINTSDSAQKQDIRELTDAEKRVASKIKTLIKAYKFKDAVNSKGSAARVHVGAMAQDVEQAFAEENLSASDYGLFCYDQWTELVDPETGEVTREAGSSYGLRYNELLAFIIAASN